MATTTDHGNAPADGRNQSAGASPGMTCRSCGSERVRIFHEAHGTPVNNVLLLPTRREAIEFPQGDIRLGFCEGCGFIYNVAFDPRLPEYSERCEETQGFSPTFRAWHETLARRLIDRYELRGKKIIEIGCGKGEFLEMLCDLGENRGLGFDPAFRPEHEPDPDMCGHVEFIRDNYSERYAGHQADFVCCKMTLEHICEPGEFIAMLRRTLDGERRTPVFFQMPDVSRVLEETAFWDIYYEHCSYFSPGSLARLFRRSGFELVDLTRGYNDQYLMIEALPASGNSGRSLPIEDDLSKLDRMVSSFERRFSHQVSTWRARLQDYRERNLRPVIWGAGSKGVAFLTTLDDLGAIGYAVDINPNKHGHYMPTTGQEIVAPEFLRDYCPGVVIIMNRVYREEIATQLECMGLQPELVCT